MRVLGLSFSSPICVHHHTLHRILVQSPRVALTRSPPVQPARVRVQWGVSGDAREPPRERVCQGAHAAAHTFDDYSSMILTFNPFDLSVYKQCPNNLGSWAACACMRAAGCAWWCWRTATRAPMPRRACCCTRASSASLPPRTSRGKSSRCVPWAPRMGCDGV
jgi:hypothetical protein